jgi:hypothetical protein
MYRGYAVCAESHKVATATLATMQAWRHHFAMRSIKIKDVPAKTHAVLRRRAEEAHQSLEEYLRSRLILEAAQPSIEEIMRRVATRRGGSASIQVVTELMREDRAGR